ncbi:MAG: hypothetical protein ACI9IP_003054 [Arcticibacterium sp.]
MFSRLKLEGVIDQQGLFSFLTEFIQARIACEKEAAEGVKSVDASLKICNMNRLNSRAAYIEVTIKEGYSFLQFKSSRDDEQ